MEKRSNRPSHRPSLSPALALGLLVSAYFLLAFGLSLLRSEELYTGNWDLGIFQQAFWSTSHGHPFYEAGDYEMSGLGSLFQVHPAPLLVALQAAYALFPQAATLFVLQSAVVSLAAVPLFFLARDVTRSGGKALLVSGLYLLWPPLLAANLYDFHLESFLPLELFLLFLLWSRGRYAWGLLVAALACATIEVGPVLVAFVALYFLLPPLRTLAQRSLATLGFGPGAPPIRERWVPLGRSAARWLSRRPVQMAGILFVVSVVAYLLLRFVQGSPQFLLLPVVPLPANPARPVLDMGLYISLNHLVIDVPQKVGYWLLLYALVGFLPLRALRTQLIALPWIVYTFVSHSVFTVWGNQYGFLPVFPLFLGLAFGLRDLEAGSLAEALRAMGTWLHPRRRAGGTGARTTPRAGRSPLAPRAVVTWVLIALIVAGLALSPADPLVQRSSLGDGYQVSYVPMPNYAQVRQLVALLPPGATVLASNDLFPLVANDLNAYALLWTSEIPPYLPFNSTHPPPFALLASSQMGSVPGWLTSLLRDPAAYRVLGSVPGTDQGTVTLFALTLPAIAQGGPSPR